MTEWWLYFGDIPPSKIVEFIVEEAIPLSASAVTMGGGAVAT